MLYGVARKNPAAAQAFQRTKTSLFLTIFLAKLHKMTPTYINAKASFMVKVGNAFYKEVVKMAKENGVEVLKQASRRT